MNRYKSFLLATLLVLSSSLMAIAQQGGQFRVLVFSNCWLPSPIYPEWGNGPQKNGRKTCVFSVHL